MAGAIVSQNNKIQNFATHIIQEGETLRIIAEKHYGKRDYSKQLFELQENKAMLSEGADKVRPGMKVVLFDLAAWITENRLIPQRGEVQGVANQLVMPPSRAVNPTTPSKLNKSQPSQGTTVAFEPKVALSFDDGPNDSTNKTLDVLREKNVKATFFLIGKQIEGREEIVRRIIEEGHKIGNHAYSHKNFEEIDNATLQDELKRTQDEINRALGDLGPYPMILVRPPGGHRAAEDVTAVEELGYNLTTWNVNPEDHKYNDSEYTEIIKRIYKRIFEDKDFNTSQGKKANILLHDRSQTVKALPELIDGLREANCTFIFTEECPTD